VNGFLVVDKEDFENMTSKQREWLFYNTLRALSEGVKSLKTAHIRWSLIGGVIGGGLIMACMLGIPELMLKIVSW